MKGGSFFVQFINASKRWYFWCEHPPTAPACCGYIAAVAADIPMIDATTAMVSNVIVAFLIIVVPSHHCYYDQVYWLGASISMCFLIG